MSKLLRKIEAEAVSPPPPGSLVLLSACDVVYLDYALRLVRSAEVFSPGAFFALHVVNPTAEARQLVAELKTSLHHTQLWVSYESVDLNGRTLENRRAYYACVRFLRLAELMSEWSTDFLVLDSDALVVNPLKGPFSQDSDAQICLLQRDLGKKPVPEHLAVAAGTVWLHNVQVVREFVSRLASELQAALENEEASWFIDQRILGRLVRDRSNAVQVGNIDNRYVDWTFTDESVIWQGKGDRKLNDLRFVLLSHLLSHSETVKENAFSVVRLLMDRPETSVTDALLARIMRLSVRVHQRVVILVPRLDLPWKKPMANNIPMLTDDVLELRLHWVRFATLLANACEAAGIHVEIVQVPMWKINRRFVESFGASVVLVPHRCSNDFEPGSTPVLFYMQEYFRWMFVVDPEGWSAAASVYPLAPERFAQVVVPGAYCYYRNKLESGNMPSKFTQPNHNFKSRIGHPSSRPFWSRLLGLKALEVESSVVPKIFFPLQIRHDQSIQYFSDYKFDDVLQAVLDWGEQRGVEIHLKAHPANPKLMQEYLRRYPETTWRKWRNENVHDLIDECDAVFVVNSGVGFEALLHSKPIVMFGRAEYDCVAIRAQPDSIDAAWDVCRRSKPKQLEKAYRQFFDWFTTEYAVDMSRVDVRDRSLKRVVEQIACIARVQTDDVVA
jgi:hypothetical protein